MKNRDRQPIEILGHSSDGSAQCCERSPAARARKERVDLSKHVIKMQGDVGDCKATILPANSRVDGQRSSEGRVTARHSACHELPEQVRRERARVL